MGIRLAERGVRLQDSTAIPRKTHLRNGKIVCLRQLQFYFFHCRVRFAIRSKLSVSRTCSLSVKFKYLIEIVGIQHGSVFVSVESLSPTGLKVRCQSLCLLIR